MQPLASRALGLCFGGLVVVLTAAPVDAQYSNGFAWNRHSDWTPGSVPGTSLNNPGPDAAGNPVWSCELAHGGKLGSAEPWYAADTELLTWDPSWWASGRGAWSRGDEANPPVFDNFLTHNLGASNFDNIPVVRWSNPAGDGAVLDMAGTLRILWTGEGFVGTETDVDVIIGIFDASAQAVNLVLSTTVSKPHAGLSIGDWAEVPVSIDTLTLDADDSILISARGHDVRPGHWIDLHDAELQITLVPGTGTASVFAAAAVVASRRRRR